MRRILLVVSLAFLLVVSLTAALSKEVDLPEVSFEDESKVVLEDVGQVDIGVTLSQSSTVTATVGYKTRGEGAVVGRDFLTTTGRLTFTPGITRQMVSLTVLDDTQPEPDKSLLLVLYDPVSVTLGLYPTTTITLTDDGDLYLSFLPIVARRWPRIPYDSDAAAIKVRLPTAHSEESLLINV